MNKNSEIDKKRKSSIKNNVKPTKKFSIDLAESINFQNTYTSQENKKENKNENILKESFNQTFKQPVYKNRNSDVLDARTIELLKEMFSYGENTDLRT